MEYQPHKKTGRPPKKDKSKKSPYTMSPAALAVRHKNSPPALAKTPEEINYNARLIDHVLKTQAIAAQTDKTDPVSVRSAIYSYLVLCQEDGFKVSNLSICAAIGIAPETLRNWLRNDSPDRVEFKELAQLVHEICALSREQLIADNKLNPVIGIFWQRNYDGLRNDTEQVQQYDTDIDSDTRTASEYAKKYGHLIPE